MQSPAEAVTGDLLDLALQTNLILDFPGNGTDGRSSCACLLATEHIQFSSADMSPGDCLEGGCVCME